MDQTPRATLPNDAELAALPAVELVGIVRSQAQTIEALSQQMAAAAHQLEWFKRQMFGTKSERMLVLENPQQMVLGEVLAPPDTPAPAVNPALADMPEPCPS